MPILKSHEKRIPYTYLLGGYNSVGLSLLISVFFISAGCKKTTEAKPQSQSSHQSQLVKEFYRLAQKDVSEAGLSSSIRLYVSKLPQEDQLTIARATADDPDPRFNSFGLNLLVQSGHEDEAVPKFARMVAANHDLTGFGWMWLHGEDDLLATRMYVEISHYLLDHSEELHGEELERANLFLCQDGFGAPLRHCSRAAVIERLQKIETSVLKRGQSRRP
ncbi:MAG: hypothetical protein WCD76_15195 [Pyrinomonadaceae bacterium]